MQCDKDHQINCNYLRQPTVKLITKHNYRHCFHENTVVESLQLFFKGPQPNQPVFNTNYFSICNYTKCERNHWAPEYDDGHRSLCPGDSIYGQMALCAHTHTHTHTHTHAQYINHNQRPSVWACDHEAIVVGRHGPAPTCRGGGKRGETRHLAAIRGSWTERRERWREGGGRLASSSVQAGVPVGFLSEGCV